MSSIRSKRMPSNMPSSRPGTRGTRMNSPSVPLRIMSTTSSELKFFSAAFTFWSDPRGAFTLPGNTSIAYGLAASARVITSNADRPWRIDSGPNDTAAAIPTSTIRSAAANRRRASWSIVRLVLSARHCSVACSTSFSSRAGDADALAVLTVSTALRIDASRLGSCSST